MWVLVLVPPLLRSRSGGRPNHSISSFQRQLRTLQRTGGYPSRPVSYLRAPAPGRRPSTVDPYAEDYDDDYAPRPRGYAPAPRYGAPTSVRSVGYGSARPASPSAFSARYGASRREAVRKRRQNVLFTLLGAAFVTAVVGDRKSVV